MKRSHTILILISSIAIVLVTLGTLVFFFRVIKNKNEHTSAVINTLADKMAQKDQSQALIEKTSQVSTDKSLIDSYFVDSSSQGIVSFISYLEGLGSDTGTKVKVESFDISKSSKNILIVKISAQGSFSDVMKTLVLLENSPYKIHVDRVYFNQQADISNINVKDSKKSPTNPTWTSEVSFNVLTSS